MKKHKINYETILKITRSMSSTMDAEDVIMLTVEGIKTAMEVKGCALFLIDKKSNELKLAGAHGLSDDYLNKGPLSALKSIAATLEQGPVAVYDVSDDPRLQYPEAAKKEGIASIMSVPIVIHNNIIGVLRIYTAEPWEFTLEDVNFVQAVAQIAGMAIENCRYAKGLKGSIEILKGLRDPRSLKSRKRTPYEGVPKTVPSGEVSA
jgi:signal transduction protein with GAF and PtsI domain